MIVAIKVVRPERTDKTNLARFSAESQALALLDHPNIAKIYDAGVAEDRVPYMVMEYVQGVPLNIYCDQERLTIKQRLELMAKICEAVHHAHTQGLIHRDLSPDNILVTIHENATAEPKIVDFGIAKAVNKNLRLTDQALTQDLNTLIGKPAYMAPEQAEAKQVGVDTRTDIFSLGVILYEMLTGVLPIPLEQLREQAIDAVLTMLRGDRPDPSTRIQTLTDQQSREVAERRRVAGPADLRRLFRGRVQHLPMKALRIDRTKRFTSAAAMALDIRNYLEGKDFVEAAAEPWWDKAQRHIRRYTLPYAAAAVIMLALLGGIAGTTWGMQQAQTAWAAEEVERRTAERERAIAESINDFLNSDVLGIHHRDVFAEDMRVVDALDEAMQSLMSGGRFAGEPLIAGRLLNTLGEAYLAIGALEAASAALSRAQELLALGGEKYAATLLQIDIYLGEIQYRRGDCDAAEALIHPAYISLLELLGQDDPAVAIARNQLANVYKCRGKLEEAARLYQSAIADFQRIRANHPQRLIAQHNLGLVHFDRGRHVFASDPTQAEQLFSESLALLKATHHDMTAQLGTDSRISLATAALVARCMTWLGRAEGSEERLREAASYYEDLLPKMERVLTSGHWRTIHTIANAGNVHRFLGDHEAALAHYEEAVTRFHATHEPTDPDLATTFRHLIDALLATGQRESARERLSEQIDMLRAASSPEPLLSELTTILHDLSQVDE